MGHIESIRTEVAKLYGQRTQAQDIWTDWIYPNHTLVVAKYAREVAERHGIDADMCEAVALLHDIGDAVTSRHDPAHGQVSLEKAEELLVAAGYDEQMVRRLVDDALRYHSCHGDDRPQSDEGKVLATADALAHFLTDFYAFMQDNVFKDRGVEVFRGWAAEKIERDYRVKIFYDDERLAVASTYEKLRKLFN
jgi:putative nucleotidyltransferase with HDIG domain